jgi:hypothetical protein
VICSHGFIKSTSKADKKQVKKAVNIRKEYLKTKKMDVLELGNGELTE